MAKYLVFLSLFCVLLVSSVQADEDLLTKLVAKAQEQAAAQNPSSTTTTTTTTPSPSPAAEVPDENICLLYAGVNFTGPDPLLSLGPTVKVFETNLLFHPKSISSDGTTKDARGIVIQSVKLTQPNCTVILCNEKHLQGDCAQWTESNPDISGEERNILTTPIHTSVRSIDCHCSFLNPLDIIPLPKSDHPAELSSGKLKIDGDAPTAEVTEGYPVQVPTSSSSLASCAMVYRDWHFKGASFSLDFPGSTGKIELGLSPHKVRSVAVENGCTVRLWRYENEKELRAFSTAEHVSFLETNGTKERNDFDWACCYCDQCSESVCQNTEKLTRGKMILGSSPPPQDFSQFVKYSKKIIGIGRNYRWTKIELAKSFPVPKKPIVFLKPSTSYIREGQLIQLPSSLGTIFYELELGVVIGSGGKAIPESQALDHVAGYFLALDMTAKEFIKQSGNQSLPWEIGKGFDTACPVGEFIPKSMIPDPNNVPLECQVNGEVTQSDSTSNMIFNVQQLIAYVSKYMTLEPYDVILTGTPDGFGALKEGDVVEGRLGNLTTIKFMTAKLVDK